jgi:HAD superfamily hydrolase (TIGR01484 family)
MAFDKTDWLLIADFDNTQVKTSGQKVQPSSELPYSFLLKNMAEEGKIPLVHCTGRSPKHIFRDILNRGDSSFPAPHAAKARAILASVGTEAFELDDETGQYVELEGLINPDAAEFFTSHYEVLKDALRSVEGLELQSDAHLGKYKISAWKQKGSEKSNDELLAGVKASLEAHDVKESDISITASMQAKFAVDITPAGATKGNAVRFIADRYDVPLSKVVVAGDSINDEAMMLVDDVNIILPGNAQDILVKSILEKVEGQSRIFKAESSYAKGVFEGLEHYGMIDRVPEVPKVLEHLARWKPSVGNVPETGLKLG